MKKQRKIISILLVLLMALATSIIMAGCGDDPLETFNKATDNMNKADNMSFDGSGKMTLKSSGQTMELNLDFKGDFIKSTTDDPGDMQLGAEFNYSMLGETGSAKVYIKDKTAYFDDGTTKTKSALDKNSLEQLKSLFENQSDLKIDDYVKDSSQDGDTLKFTLDTEKYMAAAMKKLDELTDSDSKSAMGNFDIKTLEEQIKNAGLKDMDLEATVKDDNFTSMKYTIPMKMDGAAFGSNEKIEAEITLEMSNITVNGDIKEVKIPNEKSFK